MQNAASEHSTARLPTPPQAADHVTSPPLTAAATPNHAARACLRGRPAARAGRTAGCSAVFPILLSTLPGKPLGRAVNIGQVTPLQAAAVTPRRCGHAICRRGQAPGRCRIWLIPGFRHGTYVNRRNSPSQASLTALAGYVAEKPPSTYSVCPVT
jgi:hypothetical protein